MLTIQPAKLPDPMDQTSAPQPIAPSKAEDPNLPVESVALTPENILEPAPTTTRAPPEILKRGDDRYYAQHWGINE
jgi:hypothetical protein